MSNAIKLPVRYDAVHSDIRDADEVVIALPSWSRSTTRKSADSVGNQIAAALNDRKLLSDLVEAMRAYRLIDSFAPDKRRHYALLDALANAEKSLGKED